MHRYLGSQALLLSIPRNRFNNDYAEPCVKPRGRGTARVGRAAASDSSA